MAASFFLLGRIRTTEAKAKELRPWAEKFITRGRTPTLANRRLLAACFNPRIVARVIERAGEVSGRAGGYTRIVKMGPRKSDGAKMAIIELVK
jgi:large subunit ribosomal protein L17